MEKQWNRQNRILLERRRLLRKNTTLVERKLWEALQKSKLGAKFIRQYSVGPYILDFYAPKLKLAIELDGNHHANTETQEYDKIRTEFLNMADIEVLRFWNSEIINDFILVLEKILQVTQGIQNSPLEVRGDKNELTDEG